MNLSQDLQAFLNYPVLQKIDSSTELPENEDLYDAVSQSVLIIFLTGMYKATRTKLNAEEIQKQQNSKDLLDKIFENKAAVLTVIADFTKRKENFINSQLETVANGYLKLINQSNYAVELKKENSLEDLLTSERHKILLCLSPKLYAGKLFNDESLDYNTNKMEGPLSFLLNKIEDVFSEDD